MLNNKINVNDRISDIRNPLNITFIKSQSNVYVTQKRTTKICY